MRRSRRDVVLIACPPGDGHAIAAALHLAELGLRPVPLDLARLPAAGLAVRLGGGRAPRALLGTAEGLLDPAEVRAVWWRRPQPAETWPPGPGPRRLSDGEWSSAIAGLVRVVGGFWVNEPAAEEAARRKIVQLEAARRVGLPVPRTLVTNDPAVAADFVKTCRRGAVVKSLSSLREGGKTRATPPGDPLLSDRLAVGPAILQERVDGLDYRVTCVGREVFAMSLDARVGDNPVDVRAGWEKVVRTARPARMPPELSRRLLALLRALGLRYGAVDLRRRPGGGWAFLEVNPGGQWMHAEAATGHPIGRTLARLLASGGGGRSGGVAGPGGGGASRRTRLSARPSPSLP